MRHLSDVIVSGAQRNDPTSSSLLHCSSFPLCWQSRVAVMHVSTVFLVCPLIIGE